MNIRLYANLPTPTLAAPRRLRWGLGVVVLWLALVLWGLAPTSACAQSADLPFAPDVNGTVYAIAVQADGKIVIGGNFTTVNGITRNRIARLLPDGSLDDSFQVSLNNYPLAIDVLPDDSLLVGGGFTTVNARSRPLLAHILSDGTVDAAFPTGNWTGSGYIWSVRRQSDGKILLGGNYTISGAPNISYLARLEADGAVDTGFIPSPSGPVYDLYVTSSDQIVVGGAFSVIGGVARSNIAKLQSNGSIDSTFLASTDGVVFAVTMQEDGHLLIGGAFNYVDGTRQLKLARLSATGALAAGFVQYGGAFVYKIVVASDGRVLIGNAGQTLGSVSTYLSRYLPDGTLDSEFIGSGPVWVPQEVRAIALQRDGDILIGGSFTQIANKPRNRLARLSEAGTLDDVFATGTDEIVYALGVLSDRRVLVGGAFSSIDAQPASAIARLTVTDSVDTAYTTTVAGIVYSILVQPDHAYLIGGNFTAINGVQRSNLVRVLSDNTLDPTHAPNPDGPVYSLLRQPDGKMLVAGEFTSLDGSNIPYLTRLNPTGTFDTNFVPNPSAPVRAVDDQSDGRIVVGGAFTSIDGFPAARLARLNLDGSRDVSFAASATGGDVYALLVQPDGKIVVGGAFTQINGQPRPYFARLEANGALDAAFAPTTTVGGSVYAMALQPDGRLIVGGAFTSVSVGGTPIARNHIARFNADGSLDLDWNPDANDTVYAIALQPDGKVLIGGAFTMVGGQPHGHLARLSSDLAAFQEITVASDGDSVLWTQAGAGPELSAVHFYSSTDSVNYVSMGEGVRVESGWTITGTALPISQTAWVKAYGEYPSGQSNGSTSAYDSVRIAYVRAADIYMATQLVGGAAQPADWTYSAGGKQAAGNATLRLDAGSYTVTVSGPTNYTLTGVSGACSLTGATITLNAALGANTCTFTFVRHTGTITFEKVVEGGLAQPADFSFTVLTQTVGHNGQMLLETGTYTVTESPVAGYAARAAAGACVLSNGALQLTVNQVGGTCTVTNARVITLTNIVQGGSAQPGDFTFYVAGAAVAPGAPIVLAPGAYPVTQTAPADYTVVAATGDCTLTGGAVQLTAPGAGQCTITNRRDTGSVSFVKVVEGGAAQPADFRFTVLTQTVGHNGQMILDTGSYTVAESGPAGYWLRSATGVCKVVDGALQLNVSQSGGACIVANTQAVTFAKLVEGGLAVASDWSFVVAGQTITPGGQALIAPGTYTVTEIGPAHYSLVAATGDCTLDGEVARLTVPGLGQCSLTSRRDTGTITFATQVEGDGAAPGDFVYTVQGQNATDGGQLTLPTDEYTLSIAGTAGFLPRLAAGACTLVDGEVQLLVAKGGGTCSVTLTRPVKFVSVVEGGTRLPATWSLRLDGQTVFHNRTILLAPGVYTPTLQGTVATYTLVAAHDACSLDDQGNLTLTAPGNGVCTVVNRRNTGDIVFSRIIQGGDAQPADWVMLVNGQQVNVGVTTTIDTNTYVVTESGPPDYVVTSASGVCSLDRGQIKLVVTTAGGECALVSTRGIGPVGFVMYPGGGTALAEQWSFAVAGQVVAHNGALLMPVGVYPVTVLGPEGYTIISASGICTLREDGSVELTVGVEGGACNLQSAYDAGGVGAVGFLVAPTDDAPPEAWSFVVNGQALDNNDALLMPVGVYPVTVNGPVGYHLVAAAGLCTLVDGAVQLTVPVGGGTCTVQPAPNAAPPADFSLFLPAVRR